MSLKRLLRFALLPLLTAAGCAAPSDEVSGDESAIEIRIQMPEVAQLAEKRWYQNEARKISGAGSVLALRIDDGPITFVEEDSQQLQPPSVPSPTGSLVLLDTTSTAPVAFHFSLQMARDHVPHGLFLCGDAGKLVITIDGEEMVSDPRVCVLGFERSFDEVLPPDATALPSRLHTASISAKVAGASGVKHSVMAGFVIAERRSSAP